MTGWFDRWKTFLARHLPFLPVSRHRKILAWLTSRGYRPVEVLSWEKAYRVEKEGEHFVFKCLSPQGVCIWQEVLEKLAGPFRRLVVPRALRLSQTDSIGPWVLRRWIEGVPMCADWSELMEPGSVTLPLDRVGWVVDLLEDLNSIDAQPFLGANIPRRDRSFLHDQIHHELRSAEQKGLLTAAEKDRVWKLVDPVFGCAESGPWRLSNHDFYFRNFLELPGGQVMLLDWEVARISCFEIEHCASYLWMLLWNCPEWRAEFLRQTQRRLKITAEKFRAALIVNALHQAMFVWREQPTLQAKVWNVFQEALDDDRFVAIWNHE